MKKPIKIILIGLLIIILIILLYPQLSHPQLSHPKCLLGGGIWRTFSNGCVDSCPTNEQLLDKNRICTMAFTDGCDCGEDKCWDGNKCVLNQGLQVKNTLENKDFIIVNQTKYYYNISKYYECKKTRKDATTQVHKKGDLLISFYKEVDYDKAMFLLDYYNLTNREMRTSRLGVTGVVKVKEEYLMVWICELIKYEIVRNTGVNALVRAL